MTCQEARKKRLFRGSLSRMGFKNLFPKASSCLPEVKWLWYYRRLVVFTTAWNKTNCKTRDYKTEKGRVSSFAFELACWCCDLGSATSRTREKKVAGKLISPSSTTKSAKSHNEQKEEFSLDDIKSMLSWVHHSVAPFVSLAKISEKKKTYGKILQKWS